MEYPLTKAHQNGDDYEVEDGGKIVIKSGATLEIAAGATVTGLAAVVEQTALADLTENSGAIGGTNDGNLPDLAATYAARTNSTGGTANGSLAAVGATNGGDVSGVINDNFTELHTVIAQLAADNVALRAAARENAAKINAALAKLRGADVIADA